MRRVCWNRGKYLKLNLTKWLTWSACSAIWVSCIVWDALTDATMSLGIAIGKFSTLTWINTLVALTSQGVMTVRVHQALVLPAPIVRISSVALRTRAVGRVKSGGADSILAAGLVRAGVLTLPIIACQGRFTFAVTLASSWWRYFMTIWEMKKVPQEIILRSLQTVFGSPTKPRRQAQIARCLLTEHCALMPHARVVQGSRHFSWIHARWSGHSESVVHSGLGAERACFDCLIMRFYIFGGAECSHMVFAWMLFHLMLAICSTWVGFFESSLLRLSVHLLFIKPGLTFPDLFITTWVRKNYSCH